MEELERKWGGEIWDYINHGNLKVFLRIKYN